MPKSRRWRKKTIFVQFFAAIILVFSSCDFYSTAFGVCVHIPLAESEKKNANFDIKKQRGDSDGGATSRHSHKTQLNAICHRMSICVVMVYVWITLSLLFRHYFYLISFSFDRDPLFAQNNRKRIGCEFRFGIDSYLSPAKLATNCLQLWEPYSPMQSIKKNRISIENVVRNHGYNINTIMFMDYWASVDDVRFGASAKETCTLLASCETCQSSKVFAAVGPKYSQFWVKSINFWFSGMLLFDMRNNAHFERFLLWKLWSVLGHNVYPNGR